MFDVCMYVCMHVYVCVQAALGCVVHGRVAVLVHDSLRPPGEEVVLHRVVILQESRAQDPLNASLRYRPVNTLNAISDTKHTVWVRTPRERCDAAELVGRQSALPRRYCVQSSASCGHKRGVGAKQRLSSAWILPALCCCFFRHVRTAPLRCRLCSLTVASRSARPRSSLWIQAAVLNHGIAGSFVCLFVPLAKASDTQDCRRGNHVATIL